jgi:RND family efflux transporter MFP subunit
VKFDALPGKTLAGTVDEVGVTTVEGGATFLVTVKLNRPEKEIRAGMAAEVLFEFGQKDAPPRIIVPAVAVGEDRKGRFVFIAEATGPGKGVVKRRPVEVGELTSDGLEITSGLADGDIVVTAGLSFLEDGRKVRLPGSSGKK